MHVRWLSWAATHLLLAVVAVTVILVPAAAQSQIEIPRLPAAAGRNTTPSGAEIEPALLDALSEPGATADCVVIMAEQADLSAAHEIESWQARGRYVYDTLVEVAHRTQAPVLAGARSAGMQAHSLLSANAVYVEDVDLATMQALALVPGVARIRLPHLAQIQPAVPSFPAMAGLPIEPPTPQAYGYNLDALDPAAGLYGMQAAQVWQQYGIRGEDIVVANIDTGAYYEHVAIDRQYRGNVTGNIGGPYDHNYNWYQPNFQLCGNGLSPCDADSLYGHGTGTISLVAGETPNLSHQTGVAPASRWIACQGCDDPPYCTELALTLCADWMLAPCALNDDPGDPSCDPDRRPHVVNNSWGGTGCSTWYEPYVQAWVAAGIFPAFAAGNAGGCGTLGSPGDLPDSFGIAAHFTDGNNAYAGGPSCFYQVPTCDPDAHDVDPHVNAPTGGQSAGPSQGHYLALGGTSGAAPHAAGTVALLWSANPGLIGQVDATFTILEQSANRERPAVTCGQPACAGPDGYPNYDFGWGYLDALAGVEMAGVGALGALDGSVVEAGSLDPLADVTITAARAATAYLFRTETDPAGYYTKTLSAGVYTVTADGPMHGPATATGVAVTTGTVTTLDFQLLLKGRVYGYVTDADTGAPVAGTVRTRAVPPVDTDPASGYYSIRLGEGNHEMVVEANNYASQTLTIDVASGQEYQRDFGLVASLAVAPQPIEATVELSGMLDVTTVISNRTAAPYDMALTHDAARAGDEGTVLLVDDEHLEENPAAFEVALASLGYDYLRLDVSAFLSATLPDLLDYAAVLYAGRPDAGAEQDQVMAYLDAGGHFLLADSLFTAQYHDGRLHRDYLQAEFDGFEEWPAPQVGLDIMAGLTPDILSDIYLYDSFARAEGVGIFQAPGGHYTGIRTARAGYRAIFLSFDLNRIGVREPGDTMETLVLERAMLWLLGYPVDAPWFSTDVSAATIPAGGSLAVQSQFDATPASGINQPGEFYARLHVEPAAVGEIYPRIDVPVHMTVVPRATMGKIAGTVTGDRPGGPLQARLYIEPAGGGPGWDVTSDWWTGGYGYWVEAGDYDLTVTAAGYYTETGQASVAAGMTSTLDFALTLAAPHIVLSEAALAQELGMGEVATQALRVDNLGPEPLSFQVEERDRGSTPLRGDRAGTAGDVSGARILFDASHGGNPTYYDEMFADLAALGATIEVWSSGYLTATALSGYDVLFLGDFADVAYRFDELDAIDAFVRQGGGLFVSYECCEPAGVPAVTSLFDIFYPGGTGGTSGVTHDIYPHPATKGVGSVALPSRQYMMTVPVTGTARTMVYDVGGDPAVAVNEPGTGKVFVIADQAFWDTVYSQADNTRLARNAFGWLHGGVAWLASEPVSGTVAPGEALTLAVTLDAGAVDEPAIYYGDLVLPNNDPLAPSPVVPITLTVVPGPDQGRLRGTVTSDRTGEPLAAAVQVEGSLGLSLTLYTLPTTGVYDRWLPADVYTVSASADGYLPTMAVVDVVAGGTQVLDLALILDAPWVAPSPPAVGEIVVWGMTATQRMTIANPGVQELDWTLVEEDLGSEPRLQETPAYVFDYANDNLIRFILEDPTSWTVVAPLPGDHPVGGDFRANDFGQLYVIDGDYLATLDTATGDSTLIGSTGLPYPHRWVGMTIAGDGTIYGVSDHWYGFPWEPHESYLWTLDPDHGSATQVGQITNAEVVIDVAIDRSGAMYGLEVENDVVLQIDPATGAGTVLGPVGLDVWDGALEFDDDTDSLYMATYEYIPDQSHLRIVDVATGTSTIVRPFPPGAAASFLAIAADGRVGIPWLSESPTQGTVAAGGEQVVDLDFDATGVVGPGSYLGNLHIDSNDPLIPDLPLPITMTVLPSADLGEVRGVVQGAGYCDGGGGPLEATVVLEASDGVTYSTTSDAANGSYSRWVPAGAYSATVAAPQHLTATGNVEVEAMQSVTHDVTLRVDEPCLVIEPEALSVTRSVGTIWTGIVTITNGGARDLLWAMRETTDTVAIPPIPRFEGELPADASPVSIEPLRRPVVPDGGLEQPGRLSGELPALLVGEPAYALDTSSSHIVHIPNTQEPGTWNVLGQVDRFYPAGDFWHGDFSQMYALDHYTNEFLRVDVNTGAGTVVGVAHALPGHHWTGLTAAVDGTLYAVSTECNVASALYIVDRLTGEATLIGTTTGAPCLIDVAINAQGEMYAVDISSDLLFQLDPATGAATAIGLLGFNANHAQALDFEEESGTLYWAAVDDYHGELRYIDTHTGSSLSIGNFPGGVGVDCLAFATGGGDPFWGDVPWLSEVPTSGVTLAGDAFPVEVTLDTTDMITGECRTAALGLLHDDEQAESPALVPVRLCANMPWPVFTITKTLEAGDYQPGAPVTFTLVWGNDGYLETGIVISDPVPMELEYAWSLPAGSYDPAGRSLLWDVPLLDEGQRMTATVGMTISAGLAPGAGFTNTAYLLWRDQVHAASAGDWLPGACTPLDNIGVSLVTTGNLSINSPITFAVTVTPAGATPPFSYTVDGGPVQSAAAVPFRFDVTFATTGTHSVEVAAWNCTLSVPVTAHVDVDVPAWPIYYYLPVVLKNGG